MTSGCEHCGTPAPDPLPLAWSTYVDADRSAVLCDRCTREHVRAVEARLDSRWW
ncbi:MAG TPA: hypothetical protein VEY14_10690 [Nocardioidaceae bacterium]|nr:hypothetical protein [Nocardioidaceae bacterium]